MATKQEIEHAVDSGYTNELDTAYENGHYGDAQLLAADEGILKNAGCYADMFGVGLDEFMACLKATRGLAPLDSREVG